MRRTATAALLVSLSAAAHAQVTSDLVKVTHSGDGWLLTNLTKKAITGYVTHVGHEPLQFNAHLINCAPGEWENKPILPGVTTPILVKPGFESVDLPAVIFEDGSVVGAAKTLEGMDIVEEMFAFRRAEAQEYRRWLDLVSVPDHLQALDAYREAVRQYKLEKTPTSLAESGRATAAYVASRDLDQIGGEASAAHAELLERLQAHLQAATRSSRRIP